MALEQYMQPVAVHRTRPERLLLRDDEAGWYLWTGEAGDEPVDIPASLGRFLMYRPEMQILECCQRMWFVVSDLPLRAMPSPNPEIPEQEYLV